MFCGRHITISEDITYEVTNLFYTISHDIDAAIQNARRIISSGFITRLYLQTQMFTLALYLHNWENKQDNVEVSAYVTIHK